MSKSNKFMYIVYDHHDIVAYVSEEFDAEELAEVDAKKTLEKFIEDYGDGFTYRVYVV